MKTTHIRGARPLHITQIAAAATMVFAGIFILYVALPATAQAVIDPPVIDPLSFTVTEGETYDGTLTATYGGGGVLSYELMNAPVQGKLLFYADGNFNYTADRQPTDSFVGTDSMTVRVGDGVLTSDSVVVDITITEVNSAPEATPDSFIVEAGATYNGSVAGSDIDGDALTFAQASSPMYGSLSFQAPAGTFMYTADSDYDGPDSFTFTTSDGLLDSTPATINITIEPVPPKPIASQLLDEVLPGSLSDWSVYAPGGNPAFTKEEITSPYDGSTALKTSVVGNTTSLCNQPNIAKTYTVNGNTSTTYLEAYLAFTSTMEQFTFPYVVVEIYDDTDDRVGYQIYYGKDVVGSWYKTNHVDANPHLYTELPTAEGDVALDLSVMGDDIDFTSLKVTLGNYACVGQTSVTFDHLRIIAGKLGDEEENTPPVANADSFSVPQGASYTGMVTGSDTDDDPLTFELVSGPSHGSLPTIDPDGSFTYTADADYEGSDSFTFKANDGEADSAPATISITVTAEEPEKEIRLLIYNPNVPGPDNEECKGDYGALPYDYLEDNGVVVTYWCNDTVVDASVLDDYDVLYVGRARAEYYSATYIDSADLKDWVSSGGGAILESTGDSFEPGTTDMIWPGIYDLFGYNNCPSIGSSDNAGGGPLTKLIDHPIWDGVEGPVGDSDGLYDSELEDSCIGTGLKIGDAGVSAQNPMVNEFGQGRTYSGVLVDYTINEDSERYFLNVVDWVAQGGRDRDTTPPVITLIGDASVEVTVGTTYVDLGATAVDDVDGVVAVVTTGTVDTSTPGTYLLTYTATDTASNVAEETREVVVVEQKHSHSSGTRVGQRHNNAEGQVLGARTSDSPADQLRQIHLQLIKILTLYLEIISSRS